MALNTAQIIALLQLTGCGRVTTFRLANYALENSFTFDNDKSLHEFIKNCKDKKVASRMKDYELSDVESASYAAKSIIRRTEESNYGIVSFYDANYPKRLKDIKDEKGSSLSPIILYYNGDIHKANLPGIAIIGTRNPTKEGIQAGEYFGKLFSERGFNIISGLAIGCDTAGHRGALNGNGVTTAFVAHGLDTVYPPENKNLAKEIVDKGGLLISEYPIGTPLTANKLIERDRLQAGLAQATIVIQTGEKGGTMHAANATLASHKPLFVVEYKSPELLNHEKVLGNVYLKTKGAQWINTQVNLEEIAEKIKVPRQVYIQKGLF